MDHIQVQLAISYIIPTSKHMEYSSGVIFFEAATNNKSIKLSIRLFAFSIIQRPCPKSVYVQILRGNLELSGITVFSTLLQELQYICAFEKHTKYWLVTCLPCYEISWKHV